MTAPTLSRRAVLAGAAGGALTLAFRIPPRALAQPATPAPAAASEFVPNAWLTVFPDGAVEIRLHKSEMGQGVMTALPMLVAEELDCDWDRVRVAPASGRPEYASFGMQFTFGSTSVASSWLPLRTAGASARAMLVQAAANRWGADPAALRTESGTVTDPATGASLGYGELAGEAALLPVPESPPLKAIADFRLLGTPVPRLDVPDKITGRAQFASDVMEPGMLTAVMLRPPAFGSELAGFDPAPALAVPGVRQVVEVPSPGPGMPAGLAVVANAMWPALKGREALKGSVQWTPSALAGESDATLRERFTALSVQPGPAAFVAGEAEKALGRATAQLDVTYAVPFLAHVTMEPMSAAAWFRDGRVEVWAGTQGQSSVIQAASQIAGVPPEQVTLRQRYLGCGLGRRVESDAATDALHVAMAVGEPVKVIWPREEDVRRDFYRPMSVQRVRAGIDSDGKPFAWVHHTVADSASERLPFFMSEGPEGDQIDMMQVAGLTDGFLYAVPFRRVEATIARSGVPAGFWRGVGETQNIFVVECAMDELAALAGADPLQFRRDALADNPRAAAVLDLVREKSGWDEPATGMGRGVALADYGGTLVAAVAEAALDADGAPRVTRLVLAVDCGFRVNPDIAAQQVEGGALFGLSAALVERLTIEDGQVPEAAANLGGYGILRFGQAPPVETWFVESDADPTGLGEPSVVVVPPAVANAFHALTGERRRSLPLNGTS